MSSSSANTSRLNVSSTNGVVSSQKTSATIQQQQAEKDQMESTLSKMSKSSPLLPQANALNFDFISSLASSSIDNHTLRPKILKMLETVQTYLDLNNEKLIEQIGKQREHEMVDLAKKNSDLAHRQRLQELLIEAVSSGDFKKASFVYTYLGEPGSNMNFGLNGQDFNNETLSTSYGQTMEMTTNEDDSEYLIEYDDQLKEDSVFNEGVNGFDRRQIRQDNYASNVSSNEYPEEEYETPPENSLKDEKYTTGSSNEALNIDALAKSKKSQPLSPIRHLICSPGLEAKAYKTRIIILYRGKCNGVCYQNKPWSKENHIHYIINTINCNDHVSRLVKKQGIQFYNSFVLQNQERVRQLIQMYKMEKVNN